MTGAATAPVERPAHLTSAEGGGWAAPINGFRAVGALIVVVGHTWFATHIYPWRGAIHFLSIIVPVFFVISGFALYRPFVERQIDRSAPEDPRGFWWRRFLRIYPLYAFALTLYLIFLPGVRPESGRVIDYLKLFGFMQTYDPDLVTFSGIPAAWFLCDEVVFYLFVPLLARWGRRLATLLPGRPADRTAGILRGHAALAMAMIVVGQVSRTWLIHTEFPGATSLPISNADYYGFGILLALATLRIRAGRPLPRVVEVIRSRPTVAIATTAIGAVGLHLISEAPGATSGPLEDIERYALYSFVTVPLMATMVLGDPSRSFNRFLSSPRWNRLALISLHTYLWHQLVLGGFDRYVTEAAGVDFGNRFVTGVGMNVLILAVTIAWSMLWRPLLDLPYARWSRLIPRPAGAAPSPRWVRPAGIGAVAVLAASGIWVSVTYGADPAEIRAGTGTVTVIGANPGDEIRVVPIDPAVGPGAGPDDGPEADGAEGQDDNRSFDGAVAEGNVDGSGTLVLGNLEPGRYKVAQRRDGRLILERTVHVADSGENPDPDWYREPERLLAGGMGSIEMRDGIDLAVHVDLPGPIEEGPYPTVIEISGYRNADPDVAQPAGAVARGLGYATVRVNSRGSGCSGGAFEMLGPTGRADGYDVVETVAAQPWVQGSEVGLVGFSFGGLHALQAASSAPPSLSGVVALSVYGDARAAFHPGGLANSGFPVGWMQDMEADAEPAGPEWVRDRIAAGDGDCEANQVLHAHSRPLVDTFLGNDAPDDGRFADISPAAWASDIEVPVLLSVQLQDATTGTDLPTHLDAFSSSPLVRLVMTNGTHGDAVAPQLLERVHRFLSFFVASEVPGDFDAEAVLASAGADADPDMFPPSPPQPEIPAGLSFDEALFRYVAEDPVELLLASGAGPLPGAAVAVASETFASWPPPDGTPTDLVLGGDGSMSVQDGELLGATTDLVFDTDPDVAGEGYDIEGSDLLANEISTWRPPTPGTYLDWRSDPFEEPRLLAGRTRLRIWVEADTRADLQAILSEVDAEGRETFIQAGWRRIDDDIGEGEGLGDGYRSALFDLGPGGHVLTEGSSLRLQVGTPGDGQVQWSFYPPPRVDADDDGIDDPMLPRTVAVRTGAALPSTLMVRLLPFDGPFDTPACGSLRGQPCRPVPPTAPTEEDAR